MFTYHVFLRSGWIIIWKGLWPNSLDWTPPYRDNQTGGAWDIRKQLVVDSKPANCCIGGENISYGEYSVSAAKGKKSQPCSCYVPFYSVTEMEDSGVGGWRTTTLRKEASTSYASLLPWDHLLHDFKMKNALKTVLTLHVEFPTERTIQKIHMLSKQIATMLYSDPIRGPKKPWPGRLFIFCKAILNEMYVYYIRIE